MTSFEVMAALETLPFPVRFDHIDNEPAAPFGVYTFSVSPMSADNIAYMKTFEFTLRVFVEKLDAAIDAAIETLFRNNEIVWTRDEPQYYEESALYEIDYNFGIVAGE